MLKDSDILKEKERAEKEMAVLLEIGKMNKNKEEYARALNFAGEIENVLGLDFDFKEKEERDESVNKCNEIIENFFQETEGNDDIKFLIPTKISKQLIPLLRKSVIKYFCSKESEEKKNDIETVIDEAMGNVLTHCKEESKYAFVSFKIEGQRFKELTTINFSDEEIPKEVQKFLNKSKEEKKKSLEDYSNFDIERVNNTFKESKEKDFSEEEIEKICHKRGLEIVARLIENIKYEKIEAAELGFLNKFTFEI